MANPGLPYQNKLWYYVQSDYDTCPTMGDTALPVSCEVRVARPGMNADKHTENYGIETPAPTVLWEQVDDYTFHLEYVPQCDDTLLTKIINRKSDNSLEPLGFILGVNTKQTATSDQTWFEICGAKAKTINISSSINNKYVISVDFCVKSILTDGDVGFITDSLTDLAAEEPAALTGAYLGFNVAGSITKDGAAVCDIVDAVNITIEHNLRPKFDHDTKAKQYCVEGKWSGTGSFTMSMDEGGGKHWGQVVNQGQFDVVINLGGSGCPRLTLKRCKWKRPEQSLEVEDDAIMEDCEWTSRPTDGELASIESTIP